MRISDCSADVCSSDLPNALAEPAEEANDATKPALRQSRLIIGVSNTFRELRQGWIGENDGGKVADLHLFLHGDGPELNHLAGFGADKIGRASSMARVGQYVLISGDPGSIKKKK